MPVIFSAVACILCRWEELGNISKPKKTERRRPRSRRSLRGKNYSQRNKLFREVSSQWCARGETGRGAHWRECASSVVRTGKERRRAVCENSTNKILTEVCENNTNKILTEVCEINPNKIIREVCET